MITTDVARLFDECKLTQGEIDALVQCGVRTIESAHSVLTLFPSALRDKTRSEAALAWIKGRVGKSFFSKNESLLGSRVFSYGAASAPSGTILASVGGARSKLGQGDAVDLHFGGWPVVDQFDRGTCVPFALTALYEYYWKGKNGTLVDFSEQFICWATKNHSSDDQPLSESTKLQFAGEALGSWGICPFIDFDYDPISPPAGGPVAPRSPPPAVISAAIPNAKALTFYRDWDKVSYIPDAARIIAGRLREGRPIAVCLRTFSDPANAPYDNWWTYDAIEYGAVFGRPPGSVASGAHCVCITGFFPDPNEPMGGYFTFRNSWGQVRWGIRSRDNPYGKLLQSGYGTVPATYVNDWCWEMLQL